VTGARSAATVNLNPAQCFRRKLSRSLVAMVLGSKRMEGDDIKARGKLIFEAREKSKRKKSSKARATIRRKGAGA